jgi:tetratricopeptide (TPR) repeat protein
MFLKRFSTTLALHAFAGVFVCAVSSENAPALEAAPREIPVERTATVSPHPKTPIYIPPAPPRTAAFVSRICHQIERQAVVSELPPGFLAKLIWKESRFDPDAISPAGAEGIAQFMPHTARDWNLANPFEPMSAIVASARLLKYLNTRYGNLGLAAAAYNAGEKRVDTWRSGRGGLPGETRDYVFSITGHPAKTWRRGEGPEVDYNLDATMDFQTACRQFEQIKAPLQRRLANTYFNRALEETKNGDLNAALLRYTIAIRLKPKFAHAYNNRGLVLRKMGRYRAAISNYDTAIRMAPRYANAYNNRGYAKRKLGQYEPALRDYDKAIELNPSHSSAWLNRGFAKSRLGKHESAIRDFSMSIKIKPANALAYYNRALARMKLGRFKLAKQDLDQAIAIHSSYAKAYFHRARVHAEMGQRDLALKDYRHSITLNSRLRESAFEQMFGRQFANP